MRKLFMLPQGSNPAHAVSSNQLCCFCGPRYTIVMPPFDHKLPKPERD